jgi:hypothetical protein
LTEPVEVFSFLSYPTWTGFVRKCAAPKTNALFGYSSSSHLKGLQFAIHWAKSLFSDHAQMVEYFNSSGGDLVTKDPRGYWAILVDMLGICGATHGNTWYSIVICCMPYAVAYEKL